MPEGAHEKTAAALDFGANKSQADDRDRRAAHPPTVASLGIVFGPHRAGPDLSERIASAISRLISGRPCSRVVFSSIFSITLIPQFLAGDETTEEPPWPPPIMIPKRIDKKIFSSFDERSACNLPEKAVLRLPALFFLLDCLAGTGVAPRFCAVRQASSVQRPWVPHRMTRVRRTQRNSQL